MEHFRNCFWIYLMIVLLVVAFWTTVFDNLASPASNEKVSIFFIGPGLDSSALEQALFAQIQDLTQQPIRQITVDAINTMDQTAAVQLLSTRIYDIDLIILPGEMLKDFPVSTFFPEIPQEKLALYLSQPRYFCEAEVPYGILLYDAEENSRFGKFCVGNDDYYAFFSSRSVNLGGLLGTGEMQNDAALAILKYLLE